jgi:hypothetical protein
MSIHSMLQKMNALATMLASRITRSWRVILVGAAFLCLLSGGLLVYALRPHTQKQSNVAPVEQAAQTTSTETFARALDGVLMQDASSTQLLPYAVMVENSMDAWPLLGPAKANVVIEAPVEGAITRFMLLFDPSSTTTQIGPVRSARPYFVELANGIGSLYAHVGGSPEALDLLRSSADRVEDLNEFFHGKDFWRSSSRAAPHNTYTSMELLNRAASTTGAKTYAFTPWSYSDATSSSSTASSISIPYQGAYRASWTYHSETHTYRRFQGATTQHDADGTTVDVSNVVVLLSEERVLDEVGRLKIRTTGTGKALLFRDGTVQYGVWRRNAGEHLRFESNDGRDLFFARGKTWISILTSEQAFANVIKN